MDEAPILGSNREHQIFNQVVAMHGPPAYIRRALQVEAAWVGIVEQCQRRRHEWLGMVRVRLATLQALAGEWTALTPVVGPSSVDMLAVLAVELRPQLRHAPPPTASPRRLRTAWKELLASLANFNQRWQAYLLGIDLTEVNRLRDGYNRYYLLEKECAVRSAMIARQGFQRLVPARVQDLQTLFPVLPMPLPYSS
jgi:hypothetical protein